MHKARQKAAPIYSFADNSSTYCRRYGTENDSVVDMLLMLMLASCDMIWHNVKVTVNSRRTPI